MVCKGHPCINAAAGKPATWFAMASAAWRTRASAASSQSASAQRALWQFTDIHGREGTCLLKSPPQQPPVGRHPVPNVLSHSGRAPQDPCLRTSRRSSSPLLARSSCSRNSSSFLVSAIIVFYTSGTVHDACLSWVGRSIPVLQMQPCRLKALRQGTEMGGRNE
jgi:hypothetical protein